MYSASRTSIRIYSPTFGFGGGGIFHGAPFQPLGVQHALSSCERFHGAEGRADLFGFGYDTGNDIDFPVFIQALLSGRLPVFNHHTDGYPTFTTWPSAFDSSTHQVQYYKWLERAYLGGLRLVVQHAVSNQIICDLLGNGHYQPIRYSCNDMVAVDRQLDGSTTCRTTSTPRKADRARVGFASSPHPPKRAK
jgi:hypothetical protein